MNLRHNKNKLNNKMKLLHNIRNLVEGYYNHLNQEELPKHLKEQVLFRAYACKPCLDNGKCTKCGCKTPHMFYSPAKKDSDGKWAEFLNEAQWNSLKENIDLYAEFFKISKEDDIRV